MAFFDQKFKIFEISRNFRAFSDYELGSKLNYFLEIVAKRLDCVKKLELGGVKFQKNVGIDFQHSA